MSVKEHFVIKKPVAGIIFFLLLAIYGFAGVHIVFAGENTGTSSDDPVVFYVGEGCDYESISDAVSQAPVGAVIFVENGVYNESLKIKKNISIIGESRDGVILQYPCTYYWKPPLEAQCGIFKNMTIRADVDESGYKGTHAYAVHCEKTYSTKGDKILFTNCRFESVGNWDVGMGSCDGFTATFYDCEFNNLGMFYHSFGKNTGKRSNCTLNLYDCVFAPNSSVTIRNCFANNSVLKVNSSGTVFPTNGYLMVLASADAIGEALIDNDFKFGAKNVIWSEQ